ncbi:TPA: helix-turn-helix domain-containing protein [Shigella boydii]|uniref:helix-turn-helix domain-containing protein n=1 Tax=Shigella boydii TaxID=621 RepID=UPI001F4E9EB9|nr:helix-turn-helix domain-containing protein [Shigella boydii]
MLNDKHGSYSVNSLLICAQAALLGGTASNHDVINLLDVAQDIISSTMNSLAGSSAPGANVDLFAKSARSRKQNLAINSQNRIRTQREACGLTTAELARLLDLDEEIIIQWESGEYEPTISMLIPLANILGCDPMWLLTGEVTPPEQPKSEEQQHHDASQ